MITLTMYISWDDFSLRKVEHAIGKMVALAAVSNKTTCKFVTSLKVLLEIGKGHSVVCNQIRIHSDKDKKVEHSLLRSLVNCGLSFKYNWKCKM